MNTSLTGLILAGGNSNRFGSDKRFALLQQKPLIQWSFEALSPLTEEVFCSIAKHQSKPLLPFEIAFLRDIYPNAGPKGGVHAGLNQSSTEWLLVLATDLPFIQTQDLANIIAHCNASVDAVVAETEEGRQQPLCACYNKKLLPILETQLKANQLAMFSFLEAIPHIKSIPLPSTHLTNINHPSDLGNRR